MGAMCHSMYRLWLLCSLALVVACEAPSNDLSAGEALLSQRDFGGAVTLYRKAVEQERSPRALKGLGLAHAALGQHGDAVRVLEEARDGMPEDSTLRMALAGSYIELDRTARALTELEAVLVRDPGLLSAHVLAGALAHDDATRKRMLPRITALRPGAGEVAAELTITLAALQAGLGDRSTARALLREAHGARVASPAVALTAAQVYRRAERLDIAQALLSALVDTAPAIGVARMQFAAVALERGDFHAAEGALEGFPQAVLDAPTGRLIRGRILQGTGRNAAAVPLLRAALDALGPRGTGVPGAQLALASALAATGQLPAGIALLRPLVAAGQAPPEVALRLAELQARAKDLPAATATLVKLEQDEMTRPAALELLAALQVTAGALAPAAATCRRWVAALPRAYEPLLALSSVLEERDDRAGARAAAAQALALAPNAVRPQRVVLALQLKDGEREAVQARLAALGGRGSGGAELLMMVGDFHAELGERDAARKAYETALEQAADDPALWLRAARFHRHQGWTARARASLRKALQADPGYAEALVELGHLQFADGKYQEALAQYLAAGSIADGDPVALNNLARLHSRPGGDLDLALRHAERAQKRAPDSPSAMDTLAWVRYARGEHHRALTLLTRAAAALPDDPGVHYHLGMVMLALGQREAGLVELARALRAGTPFEGSAEARRLVEAAQADENTME